MKVRNEKRPWGAEEWFAINKKCSVKILTVNSGKRFSLQYHKRRKEFWKLLDNRAKITIGNKTKIVGKGFVAEIKPKMKHRIEALEKDVRVLEISFGEFDEDDIIRIEDDFGRAAKK